MHEHDSKTNITPSVVTAIEEREEEEVVGKEEDEALEEGGESQDFLIYKMRVEVPRRTVS